MGSSIVRGLAAVAATLVLLAGMTACTADFDPQPTPTDTTADQGGLPPVADPLPIDQLARFSGVATMNAGGNCTGTLIDTGAQTGPAYILTNGHCAGDIGRPAQQTTLGAEWGGTAEFFRAAGNLDHTLIVDVDQIAYSTMRHTDTAILRLEATLGDLEAQGVHPIALADAEPAEGTAVTNIAVPVQDRHRRSVGAAPRRVHPRVAAHPHRVLVAVVRCVVERLPGRAPGLQRLAAAHPR